MHDTDLKRQRKRERDRRHYQPVLDKKSVTAVEYDGAAIDWLEKYGHLLPGDTVGEAIAKMLRASVEADEK